MNPATAPTSLLLRAVAPLVPGSVEGGVALEGIEAAPEVKLSFRALDGPRFGVRLRRRRAGARYYATTGRLDLILDASERPSREIERFVRELAERIRVNTAAVSDEELDALVAAGVIANPYLRHHDTVGAGGFVDLNVGDRCNLACTFCTDVGSRGRLPFHPTSFWREELAAARARGKAGVLISGQEPTLRDDIPEIIAEARRLGFVEIELSTAGVRLADRGYLAELLDAGLNVLAVAIHGSEAEVDGAQTGRPDFFALRLKGIENFLDLVGDRAAQERTATYLKTITVFTQQNLADLPDLVALLVRHEVTYALLYYPWIKGNALRRFDEVVPDYAQVMDALRPILPRLRDPAAQVSVSNLPPCVAGDLPCGRTAVKDIVNVSPQGEDPANAAQPDHRRVSTMDPTLTYASTCTGCVARGECRGVSARYVARYGTLGLRTLT